jgi:hypothetical protein
MLEVTGVGILKVFITKNVKEIFWDLEFLSEATGCRKTQVSDHTGSTLYNHVKIVTSRNYICV